MAQVSSFDRLGPPDGTPQSPQVATGNQ